MCLPCRLRDKLGIRVSRMIMSPSCDFVRRSLDAANCVTRRIYASVTVIQICFLTRCANVGKFLSDPKGRGGCRSPKIYATGPLIV